MCFRNSRREVGVRLVPFMVGMLPTPQTPVNWFVSGPVRRWEVGFRSLPQPESGAGVGFEGEEEAEREATKGRGQKAKC